MNLNKQNVSTEFARINAFIQISRTDFLLRWRYTAVIHIFPGELPVARSLIWKRSNVSRSAGKRVPSAWCLAGGHTGGRRTRRIVDRPRWWLSGIARATSITPASAPLASSYTTFTTACCIYILFPLYVKQVGLLLTHASFSFHRNDRRYARTRSLLSNGPNLQLRPGTVFLE